tara:strand:+ start:1093 stop:1503 length:411 start_codon:yes stop_codon:yes gene_type:complete
MSNTTKKLARKVSNKSNELAIKTSAPRKTRTKTNAYVASTDKIEKLPTLDIPTLLKKPSKAELEALVEDYRKRNQSLNDQIDYLKRKAGQPGLKFLLLQEAVKQYLEIPKRKYWIFPNPAYKAVKETMLLFAYNDK